MCNCTTNNKDLLVVIIPVLITAIVTLVVTIIENIQKTITDHRKYSSEALKRVNDIIPVMYNILFSMKMIALQIESINPAPTLINTLINYYDYKNNKAEYRKAHTKDINKIPQLEMYVEEYIKCIESMDAIHSYEIPMPPIRHYIFNKKLSKMFSLFLYLPLVIKSHTNKTTNNDSFKKELRVIRKKWGDLMNSKVIQKYIDILNQWNSKY
jgi:hypothetical protein